MMQEDIDDLYRWADDGGREPDPYVPPWRRADWDAIAEFLMMWSE